MMLLLISYKIELYLVCLLCVKYYLVYVFKNESCRQIGSNLAGELLMLPVSCLTEIKTTTAANVESVTQQRIHYDVMNFDPSFNEVHIYESIR